MRNRAEMSLHGARAAAPCVLFAIAAATRAQEPPGAALPGSTRDCSVRLEDLKLRMAELARMREAMDRETARLARVTEEMDIARGRAEAAGAVEVAAYNARLASHNRDVAMQNDRIRALNADASRFNSESVAATAECNRGLRVGAGAEPMLDADERAVLAVVLADRLGSEVASVAIENRTATFLCSRSLPDLVQFDGCSGMRKASESPQDVIARLRAAWPHASDAALSDLLAKTDVRARIEEPFAIPARQVLRGYGEPAAGEAIAITIKLSRGGVAPGRNEAVAFVAWRSRGRAAAEYIRLTRGPTGNWAIVDRMRAQ